MPVSAPSNRRLRLGRPPRRGPRLYRMGARAVRPIHAVVGRLHDRRRQWRSDAPARRCFDCACICDLGSGRGRRRAAAKTDGKNSAHRPVSCRLPGQPSFPGRSLSDRALRSCSENLAQSPDDPRDAVVHPLQRGCWCKRVPGRFQGAASFRVRPWRWWREVMLPGIFPYYVTGAITASGGAWNASIVSEAVSWGSERLSASGWAPISLR